jgi:hypothetical protein
MTACLLALALGAAAPKLAVLQVAAGEGVPPSTAAAITEALVAEVRRQSGAEVITQREIASILSLEKQKAMLGCETDACMAELGGALGADRLVAGDMAKLGESFLLHVRVVEVTKVRVSAQADRRLRGGTIDDVLDVLPGVVAELFPGAAPRPGPSALAPPAPPAPPVPGPPSVPEAETVPPVAPAPPRGAAPPWVEQRENVPRSVRERFYLLTDDDGLYVALIPFQGIDTPLYAGDGTKMYRQRVVGGGPTGRLAAERLFWEPRVPAEGDARLAMRAGNATLTCGTRAIPLRVVAAGKARRMLADAEFFAPPVRDAAALVPGEVAQEGTRLGTPCDGKF